MSLSFLTPNRTVLLIADEALYVYVSGARGQRLVESVPWDFENFESHVAGILSKDCGGRPVVIINDMVEQHYRKERVMRRGVSVLDKSQVLRRKLSVAFPSYPIRAFLPLKEKPGKTEKGGASDIYIFAAVPETKQFQATIGAITMALVPVVGYGLLPIESADMVRTLSQKIIPKGSRIQWVVFMAQHRHGGLRQIVIKNGELALTRITPVTEEQDNPDVWASEVHQEFNATMSYLTRFGFQSEDGLHVIAVADDEGANALQSLIEDSFGFTSVRSTEAACMLGLPYTELDNPRYADVLHVGWTGRKPKLTLPMKSLKIDKISRPRQTAVAASALLFLAALGMGYMLFNEGSAVGEIMNDLDMNNQKLAQLNLQYQKEVQRKEALGINVRLVQSSIAVYDNLKKTNIHSLELFKDIGDAIGKEMRVDSVVIARPDPAAITVDLMPDGQPAKPPHYIATLQMTYPSTTDIDKGNQEVEGLRDRLRALMPKDKIDVTKALKDFSYQEGLVVEAGDLQKEDVSQEFVAAIEIKGAPLE